MVCLLAKIAEDEQVRRMVAASAVRSEPVDDNITAVCLARRHDGVRSCSLIKSQPPVLTAPRTHLSPLNSPASYVAASRVCKHHSRAPICTAMALGRAQGSCRRRGASERHVCHRRWIFCGGHLCRSHLYRRQLHGFVVAPTHPPTHPLRALRL